MKYLGTALMAAAMALAPMAAKAATTPLVLSAAGPGTPFPVGRPPSAAYFISPSVLCLASAGAQLTYQVEVTGESPVGQNFSAAVTWFPLDPSAVGLTGWTLNMPQSTTSCTITSAANADGIGNDVTFAFTTTATDTIRILNVAPAASAWTLNDILQGSLDVDVASGSSNAAVYLDMVVDATKAGTDVGLHPYDMYSAAGAGPTEAYSYRLQTEPLPVSTNSPDTKAYIQLVLYVVCTGSASITMTLRRANINRRFAYANGGFSG